MLKTLTVSLGVRSYPIYIGAGLLAEVGDYLAKLPFGVKALVVADRTTGRLYADPLRESLSAAGIQARLALVEDGEQVKSLASAQALYDQAFDAGLDRQSLVIALGGGVVGDLAGFVAATFLRGLPFVQVPTTLLAQVDSSVGGKVAVNHPQGKNLIGAFYQPVCVLADVALLQTLPPREWGSGLAEVIKYGVIRDEAFFIWLEQNITQLTAADLERVSYVVQQSCLNKSEIVSLDEKEGGLRAVLNFGHTIGHAVETLSGYGKYTHGEAVSIGMVAAAKLAGLMDLLSARKLERLTALLQRAGLPLEIPPDLAPEELLASLYHDKKATGGGLTFVLPTGLGHVIIKNGVDPQLVRRVLC